MHRHLQRIREIYRQAGLLPLLRKIAGAVLERMRRVFRHRVDLIMAVDFRTTPAAETRDDLVLEEIQARHKTEIEAFIRRHHPDADNALGRLNDNMAHGYHGYLGRINGEVAAYGWWIDASMQHPQTCLHDIRLAPSDVYMFDLYVARAFRTRHAGAQFIVKWQNRLVARGYACGISSVLETNRGSLWVHHLSGWKRKDRRRVIFLFGQLLWSQGRLQRNDPLWF